MKEMTVQSFTGSYPVRFFEDLPTLVSSVATTAAALVLIDAKVAGTYCESLAPILSAHPTCEINATEEEKTLEGCSRVLKFMQQHNATRQTVLIVLGGGIVQDIATLCAHLYYRGVSWHYFPTTLLGMADSCIGAKASINFNGFKNQLGVFHSPSSVAICPAFLASLSETEMRSGWGEIVKLHLAGSRAHFDAVEQALDQEGWRTSQLGALIRASLEVKRSVIEVDEFDNGIRRTLNYGHTFGHALEAITDHAIPHGIAIAWGMDLVNFIAVEEGLLAREDFVRIHRLLAQYFPFSLTRQVSAEELLAATRRDKKVKDGRLQLVLLGAPGKLSIVPRGFNARLSERIADYLAHYSIVR